MRVRLSELRQIIRGLIWEYVPRGPNPGYRSMAGGGDMRQRRFDVWPEEGYGLSQKPEDDPALDRLEDTDFYNGRDPDSEPDTGPVPGDGDRIVTQVVGVPNANASPGQVMGQAKTRQVGPVEKDWVWSGDETSDAARTGFGRRQTRTATATRGFGGKSGKI